VDGLPGLAAICGRTGASSVGGGKVGGMSEITFRDLILDACDPHALASFWAEAIGLEKHAAPDGYPMLTPPGGERGHGLTWIDPCEPRTGRTRCT
jgi:hypothetical protein